MARRGVVWTNGGKGSGRRLGRKALATVAVAAVGGSVALVAVPGSSEAATTTTPVTTVAQATNPASIDQAAVNIQTNPVQTGISGVLGALAGLTTGLQSGGPVGGVFGSLSGLTGGLTGGLVNGVVGGVVTPVVNGVVTPLVGALLNPWGDEATAQLSLDANGNYNPAKDPGSLYTVTTATGARSVWANKDGSGRAVTGQGVTVALLDSGAEALPGLDATGKIVKGPDLSFETNSDTDRGHDTFGHGTFLAGIIAAHDSGSVTSASTQLGIAPDAKILAVKAATADGSADVSQVIAGLDWIVQHKNDNGMNVRVVNLSWGTDSTQPYSIDPLAAAVENAWRHGIVVVVSAGNEGNSTTQLTDPAIDPFVVAVGAADPNLSTTGWKTPKVADFSNNGNAKRSPDLIAPGKSLTSLRDPNSYVDTEHPEGLVAGDTSGRLFRGSGTSQAAAVVSGSIALLAQAFPTATPDQLKAALTGSATKLSNVPTTLQGAGELNISAAYSKLNSMLHPTLLMLPLFPATIVAATQTFPYSTGTGSIEAARGGNDLVDPVSGSVLSGEVDAQGNAFDAVAWHIAETNNTTWNGGTWLGTQFSGGSWTNPNEWNSQRWTSARWSGAQWSDADWDSARWSSARWSSARWSSARWSSARWSSARWS